MTRDPRYDILFEPVKIGPVTARNRFYQVPHCTGIGWTQPETLARLRGIKAEGGWAVVATEETEIHPSADCEPFHEGRLWDDRDIPAMAWIAMLGLALVSTTVAFIFYYRLIADVGPVKAITVTLLVPIFGMIWGIVFLGEPVHVVGQPGPGQAAVGR